MRAQTNVDLLEKIVFWDHIVSLELDRLGS